MSPPLTFDPNLRHNRAGSAVNLLQAFLPDQVKQALVVFHPIDILVQISLKSLVILGCFGKGAELLGIIIIITVA